MPTEMKKKPEQQALERLDVGLQFVAVLDLRQQHAGHEGAERHRQPGGVGQRRGADDGQQRQGGEHLRRRAPPISAERAAAAGSGRRPG